MTNKNKEDKSLSIINIETIRKRPGMFIGSVGHKGISILLNHVVDSFIEEVIALFSNKIEIILNWDNSITITRNSNEIFPDIDLQTYQPILEKKLTIVSNWNDYINKEKYKIYGCFHFIELDIAVINGLSEWLEVTEWRNNKTYCQGYKRGKPVTKLQEKSNDDLLTGTKISFKLDPEIFTEYIFNIRTIKMRLQELAYLNRGLNIILKDCTSPQEKINHYHYPQGIKDYLSQINKNYSVINNEVIYIQEKQNDVLVEVALQWCEEDIGENSFNSFADLVFYRDWYNDYFIRERERKYNFLHLLGFANQVYTLCGGSHIEGVKQGIIQGMNNYIDRVYPDKEINLNWINLSSGLTGIVSVMLFEAKYNGSMRTELANPEVIDIVSNLVRETLNKYFIKYPHVPEQILSNFIL